jgi:hypothetical protein
MVTEAVPFTTTVDGQMILPMIYGGAQIAGASGGNGQFKWWLDGAPFGSWQGGWFSATSANMLAAISGPHFVIPTAGAHTLQLAATSAGYTSTWYCRPIALPGIEGLGITIYGL